MKFYNTLLEKTENGFVYIKVSDDYIDGVLERLSDTQAEAPPYFGKGKVGAHVTVIEANESKGKKLHLPQLGSTIAFRIVEFAKVEVANENGHRRIYMFIVDAPELKKIRQQNGLSPEIRGFAFHITTALRSLEVEAAS